MIYLDHNATTPLAPEAAAAMAPWQTSQFGNPASQHAIGRRARQALEGARDQIARMLGARLGGPAGDRLIFTSGGTEANNLALLGMARFADPQAKPGEAVISTIEHHSLSAAARLLERRGWTIHRIGVTRAGVVDLDEFDQHLSERTRFVSVMLANNETGVLQPVADIARRCGELGVPLHTDAAQMAGKLPVDLHDLGASALSVAAHKFHGPLGIGALLVRHDLELEPLLVGGFQQEGMRGGTECVALAVGMHAALAAWENDPGRAERLQALRDRLESKLRDGHSPGVVVNGLSAPRLPHTSNLALLGLDRQALVMALDLAGVACSTGSACASGSSEPSPTLAAMGCDAATLRGSVRFSLGAATTAEEVGEAVERILTVAARIAAQAPRDRTPARN